MKLFLTAIAVCTTTLLMAQTTDKAQAPADTLAVDTLLANLPEVMISGTQPIARIENGALTFDMSLLNKRLPADNAYEAIGHIPGITANDDGVKFGNRPITLIVDGKATTLDADQVRERLQAMPAERLARAEISMAAPARYHVRGAVINVVTKRQTTAHTSGLVQAGYTQSQYGHGKFRGNLFHSNGKLALDASYQYRLGRAYGESNDEALHPLASGPQQYNAMRTSENRYITHDYRLGADWQIAPDHSLSLAYTGKWSSMKSHVVSTGSGISTNDSPSHTYLHNVDCDYSLPFGLKLTASYTYYKMPETQSLDGTLLDSHRNLTAESRQTINKWLVAADQSHQLARNWTLEYGAKAQFTLNNTFQTTIDADGTPLPESTNSADIDERIAGGYVAFGKQYGQRAGFSAQVEVENYHTPRWNEWRLYPSFNLFWNPSADHMLNLALSSESEYPSYWAVMNNVYYSSAYNEIWSNPDLKPSASYALTLMWQIKRRYTLVAFAKVQPDKALQQPYQPADRMAVIMRMDNWDYRRNAGLQAMADYNLGQWLHGNAALIGLFCHDKLTDTEFLPFDRRKFTVVAMANANINLTPRLSIMVNPFWQSPSIQGLMDIHSVFTLNASARWTSANGKWIVTAKGNNLTNSDFTTSTNQGTQNYSFSVNQNWMSAELTLTYRFGDYKEKRVKQVDTSRMKR